MSAANNGPGHAASDAGQDGTLPSSPRARGGPFHRGHHLVQLPPLPAGAEPIPAKEGACERGRARKDECGRWDAPSYAKEMKSFPCAKVVASSSTERVPGYLPRNARDRLDPWILRCMKTAARGIDRAIRTLSYTRYQSHKLTDSDHGTLVGPVRSSIMFPEVGRWQLPTRCPAWEVGCCRPLPSTTANEFS